MITLLGYVGLLGKSWGLAIQGFEEGEVFEDGAEVGGTVFGTWVVLEGELFERG